MDSCFIILLALFSFHFHYLVFSCDVKRFELTHTYEENKWEGYVQPFIKFQCYDANVLLGAVYLITTERRPTPDALVITKGTTIWYAAKLAIGNSFVFTITPSDDNTAVDAGKLLNGDYAIPGMEYSVTMKISIVDGDDNRIGDTLSEVGNETLVIPPNPVEKLTILTTGSLMTISYKIRLPGYYDALRVEVWIDRNEHFRPFSILNKEDIDLKKLDLPISIEPNRRYDVMVWMKSDCAYSDTAWETSRSSKDGLLKIMMVVLVACSMSITAHYPFII